MRPLAVLKIGATTAYQLRKALSTIFKMILIVVRTWITLLWIAYVIPSRQAN
jgi:hypothetical protein